MHVSLFLTKLSLKEIFQKNGYPENCTDKAVLKQNLYPERNGSHG